MKRISSGYYKTEYKNNNIEIIKIKIDWSGEIVWYSLINGKGGNDYLPRKKDALIGAKYMIDNPDEYDIL